MRRRRFGLPALLALGISFVAAPGCGDDSGDDDTTPKGGSSNHAGTGGKGAAGDSVGGRSSAGAAGGSALGGAAGQGTSGGEAGGASTPRGALIHVELESQVGALLDELPPANRDAWAQSLLAKDDAFWLARARAQINLSTYRLVFRNYFYDDADAKGQLPLPPAELWNVELVDKPARAEVNGHDLVAVHYRLSSTLLTNEASVPKAEPALSEVGGEWDEPLVLPVDPELLLQRTGYACMDEDEFPPNSVDGENVATFYDQECEAAVQEDETQNSDCHITQHPDESCVDALDRAVGKVETNLHFERLAWDDALAEQSRLGAVTNATGADLAVIGAGLENNRIIYRYIDANSCAVQEGCVGGTGWRRLLQFDASVRNQGAEALNIGDVDYFVSMTPNTLSDHNIYVYSECHHHYHFSHYGDFVLRTPDSYIGNKQAFCLQSTARYSNNESSPLTNPYSGCDYQGIEAGWGDDYGAGIECQWIDVTGVDLSSANVSAELEFTANPDGFLCEGSPVLDANGELTFERTQFKTPDGKPVDRPVCDFADGWDANNLQSRPLELSAGGLIQSDCQRGQIGPLRDCGFTDGVGGVAGIACTAGATVRLSCAAKKATDQTVVRVCDYSAKLGMGVACVYRDALANEIVGSDASTLTFTCPGARDDEEPGGRVSIYVGSLNPDGKVGEVNCQLQ